MKDYPSIKEQVKMTRGGVYPVGGNVSRIRFKWGRRLTFDWDSTEFEVSIPEFKGALEQKRFTKLKELNGNGYLALNVHNDGVIRMEYEGKYAYVESQDMLYWTRVF